MADINLETHDLSFEYGMGYHTLEGTQKKNNSKGKLSSSQNPYWLGSYTLKIDPAFGIRLFVGLHLVRFNEPAYGSLKNENQVLNQFGFEIINRSSAIFKTGFFLMQQDHPLYRAITETDFEVIKKSFVQSGLHLSIGQRRRIGLIWGLGLKGYAIFPTSGGDVTTESGLGTEGYARLGWIDPFGTIYQVKSLYQATSAPNAEVEFSHSFLGYCFQVNHSF